MITQILLTIFSLLAIWFSLDPDETKRKWGPVFGVVAQPFWFYATFIAGQWGMFVLSIIYLAVWFRGIYTYWIKK